MFSILANVSTHELEVIRDIAAVLYVFAAVAVVIGVYFENEDRRKPIRKLGWLVLLFSLGIETVLTLAILTLDFEISARQKSEIIALNNELTGYRRPRILDQEQKDRIARAIKPFPPVKFFAITVPEAEPWDLVLDISAALKADGWDWQPFPGPSFTIQPLDGRPREGTSILDHIEIQAPPELKEVAAALQGAIKDPDVIGMDDVRLVINSSISTVTIIVGTKK